MLGAPPADRWELEVYQQLKRQLPDDWIVIANVAWSRVGPTSDYRYVRDGQADLVVIAPRMGMVVIEVKGSRSFRIAEDGRWYRQDPRSGADILVDEPPPDQATRNMHELADVVLRKGPFSEFPGLFAYVVVYPQGELTGTPPTLVDSSTLIVAAQMNDLADRIRLALSQRGSAKIGARCDAAAVKRMVDILTNCALEIAKADTPIDARDDARDIEILTRQQFAALQGIFRLPRVAVVGPAGSGKTVLAMWRLASLIEEGRRALYVCYNKTLATALQRREPLLADSIAHVDSLLYRIVERGGKRNRIISGESDPTLFFREQLPELSMDEASSWSNEDKYDAIIVDEGQDFGELQLIALLELLKPETGSYVLFADRRQDLYRASTLGAVGAEVVFSLFHNCRNTVQINLITNRFTAGNIPSMPGMPEGVEAIIDYCSSPEVMASRAWSLARSWYSSGQRVAILSPWVLERSAMNGAQRGHGLSLVTSIEDWERPDTVYFSTIKAFKGIEAAAVIVVDTEAPGSHPGFREEDLYVACTRATTRLALLSRNRTAVQWMRDANAGTIVPPTGALRMPAAAKITAKVGDGDGGLR